MNVRLPIHQHTNFLITWESRFVQYLESHTQSDQAHDLSHMQRVWTNCRQIANSESNANLTILLPASYLHDIECLPKNDPRRAHASTLSAQRALTILADLRYPLDSFEDVYHAIQSHSYSAGIAPLTLEAKILQDADRLDALGAIGLARVFHVAGQLRRPIYDHVDPFALNRPLDDNAYSLDHFNCKLLQLSETMNTGEGKRIARERTRYLKRFIATLQSELDLINS